MALCDGAGSAAQVKALAAAEPHATPRHADQKAGRKGLTGLQRSRLLRGICQCWTMTGSWNRWVHLLRGADLHYLLYLEPADSCQASSLLLARQASVCRAFRAQL